MNKKQTNSFKFIYLFFLLSIGFSKVGSSQDGVRDLAVADSLFGLNKYTESYNIYESILLEEKQTSPRMFLRMAFIKEGLGNYSEALYFLNEYYLKTSDKNAQEKMNEIALEHDLRGFDINDKTFFERQFRSYNSEILLGVFLITLFVFALILYKKIKLKQRPISFGFVLLLLSFSLFYLINYGNKSNEGIIVENHAYIMSGPSSGSDLLEVVKNGHKVEIIEELDLWTAIRWNDTKAYVRKSRIKKFS